MAPLANSSARLASFFISEPMWGIFLSNCPVSSRIFVKNSPVKVRFRYEDIAPTFFEMDI